jgi:transcriptional adapter 3
VAVGDQFPALASALPSQLQLFDHGGGSESNDGAACSDYPGWYVRRLYPLAIWCFCKMPPLATKGKGKGRDARRSRSRNTTPNSAISSSAAPSAPTLTAYLRIDTARLLVASSPQYAEIIEKLELKQGMPEPKHLDALVEQLRQLSDAAEARSQACYLAMTALSDKRKEIAEQERERERQEREAESRRARIRKEAEDADEDAVIRKAGKVKKRKERPSIREEKPLLQGVHELVPQDGVLVKQEGQSAFCFLLPPSQYTHIPCVVC